MSWWKGKAPECSGSVLFRGPLPPRPENLDYLRELGIEISPGEDKKNFHWSLHLRHPKWGEAWLVCPRDIPIPPHTLIDFDIRLTDEERTLAKSAACGVGLLLKTSVGNVLRDRKHFLRFLRAAMGPYGLVAVDHVAHALWSRDALEDELAHDADLDIQSMFTLHAVTEDKGGPVRWLHSHGLRDIGFFDFDILDPSPDVSGQGDLLRAIAFGIVEGSAKVDGEAFFLAAPGGRLRFVSADRFLAKSSSESLSTWREDLDDEHRRGHAIICEPARRWSRFFGDRPVPSRFLSGKFPEEGLIMFSNSASALMAERARSTYGVFRSLVEEFRGLGLPALVKLGYRVDGGAENDREHLWFEAHACFEDRIDATLSNSPFHIARMKEGDRGSHQADLLSDWMIMSPFGSITPRFMTAARRLRVRCGGGIPRSPRAPDIIGAE